MRSKIPVPRIQAICNFAAALMLIGLVACGGAGGGGSALAPTTVPAVELFAAGDIALCGILNPANTAAEQTARTAEALLASAGATARVLTLGDNTYFSGLKAEFDNCYAPTWGRFKTRTWATPGNHDYGVANAVGYFDYFGASAGADRTGYYRQDVAGWTVLALNSNIDAAPGSDQHIWLLGQLASAQPCIAAAWHHPVFTSASRGDNPKMAAIWASLQGARADVVLQGHEHHYERFAPLNALGHVTPDGVRSFVVGTGGADLSPFANVREGSQFQRQAHGLLRLQLRPGQLAWEFVDIVGNRLDAGSAACNAKK